MYRSSAATSSESSTSSAAPAPGKRTRTAQLAPRSSASVAPTAATSVAPPMAASTDAAGPVVQGFDLGAFLDFAPTGAGVVQGEELATTAAPASRTVDGEDSYRYEQFANGDVKVVAGPARVGELHLQGERVNLAITKEIERLHGPFPAAAAPAAPTTPAAPVTEAPATDDGGLIPSLDSILGAIGGAGQAIVDGGAALVGDLTGLVRSAFGLGGATPATPTAPAAPATPAAPVVSDTGLDPSLVAAKDLADTLKIGHGYDHDGKGKNGANETVIVDDLSDPAKRRDAIIGGKADQLDTILCSEFTNLTLAKMGVDLAQRYLVPTDRLPLGYPERGSVTFLTLFMVTNNQRETTAALIDHQNGASERVTAGSARAKELGRPDETVDFFVVAKGDIVGKAVGVDNEFGAGATAVSLGGKEIDPGARKPGDLQQAIEIDANGIATGKGHSSQVWSVLGDGVACLGQPGSPTIAGGTVTSPAAIETLSGWYALPTGALKWKIGPETDPALVASLTCVEFELIDANTGRANDDATGIGSARKDGQEVVSNGRLPSSKWIDWETRAQDVVGTLA